MHLIDKAVTAAYIVGVKLCVSATSLVLQNLHDDA